MSISRERIEALLEKIQDPDLKKGLVSAKLVQEIIIKEDQIKVIVSISNPALHARKRMHDAVIFNLERELGKEINIQCEVNLDNTKNELLSHNKKSPYGAKLLI